MGVIDQETTGGLERKFGSADALAKAAELTARGHLVPAVTYSTPVLPEVRRAAQLDKGAALDTQASGPMQTATVEAERCLRCYRLSGVLV